MFGDDREATAEYQQQCEEVPKLEQKLHDLGHILAYPEFVGPKPVLTVSDLGTREPRGVRADFTVQLVNRQLV